MYNYYGCRRPNVSSVDSGILVLRGKPTGQSARMNGWEKSPRTDVPTETGSNYVILCMKNNYDYFEKSFPGMHGASRAAYEL